MYRIIDGCGTGKTTRIVTIAKETGATIVALSPDYVRYKAERLGIYGIDIISYEEFLTSSGRQRDKKFLIDEIAVFASYVTKRNGGSLIGYTLSTDDLE